MKGNLAVRVRLRECSRIYCKVYLITSLLYCRNIYINNSLVLHCATVPCKHPSDNIFQPQVVPCNGSHTLNKFPLLCGPTFYQCQVLFSTRNGEENYIVLERERGREGADCTGGREVPTDITHHQSHVRLMTGLEQDIYSTSSSQEVTMLLTLSFICLTTEDVGYL